MKPNTPYVKQFTQSGEVINRITKDIPFINNNSSNRQQRRLVGKYIILTHPITNEFMGKLKTGGNNRKNTSARKGKQSRFNSSN